MFPKIHNWDAFVCQVQLICEFILGSVLLKFPNTHVISVDEKTAIQAIERHTARAPKSKGWHQRREFEYKRHGTTTLIAATKVENGNLLNYTVGPTRNEKDFKDFIIETVDKLPPSDKVIIIADQLNTHLSASLVEWIAQKEQYAKEQLGVKGRLGMLKNQQSRRKFLENPEHRVRFIYTPKHCSWLNPIENWFAKLQKHVIKNGNFTAVKELENKIHSYIEYYNACLAKPIKWKFKGFDKDKQLANFKYSKT